MYARGELDLEEGARRPVVVCNGKAATCNALPATRGHRRLPPILLSASESDAGSDSSWGQHMLRKLMKFFVLNRLLVRKDS